MNKRYKTINDIMFSLSIVFAVAHFIWCLAVGGVEIQSLLLNVIPYGLPVLAFILVWRELKHNGARWNVTDTVFATLFSLIYLVMIVHVTVAGAVGNFVDIYFNLPVIYAVPIALSGIVWLIARMKPTEDTAVIGKVLYLIPIIIIIVMIVHCGVLCVIEWKRNVNGANFLTSFPWWTTPLIYGTVYLIGAGLLFAVYLIYTGLKRKEKQKT